MGRLFGLFAALFGLSYLSEGVTWLLKFANGATSREFVWAHYTLAGIVADLFVGGGALLAAAGMFFGRDWGRKTWLGVLVLTLLLHAVMLTLQHALGFSLRGPLSWAGIVLGIAIISWMYLTKASVRARFR